MARSLTSMRMSYERDTLGDTEVDRDPFEQFSHWFDEAIDNGPGEANAMMVSTVGPDGQPSSRVVLMKAFGPDGFDFYTNYDSQKGQEIEAHPQVAALFYWPSLQRQVRITGVARKLTPEQSDAYFRSRPRGSQIGAIVSPQSEVVPDRAWLEAHFARAERDLEGRETLDRPDHWGGFRIVPQTIEFWQGRPNRLHDRIRYERAAHGNWEIHRLAP